MHAVHGLGLSLPAVYIIFHLWETFSPTVMRIRNVEVWAAKKKTIPLLLAHCLYHPIFLEINILRIFQCIYILPSIFLVEKQTELHVGFSKVLTAIAKWWNKLSECFSLEKCFFACFITLTLQTFLLTDGYSQELILPPLNTLQGYQQHLTLCLKVHMTFNSFLSTFFSAHACIALSTPHPIPGTKKSTSFNSQIFSL